MLPNAETLIPAIDKVVDHNFGIVPEAVEWHHELRRGAGLAATIEDAWGGGVGALGDQRPT